MRATHPRSIRADIALAALVVALAGCGNVSSSGSDASGGTMGGGGGGASGVAGTTGTAGATGAAGRGGTIGTAGSDATGRGGTTGTAGSGAAGRGGTTGTAGSGVAGGRGGTTGAAGSGAGGRGGTTGAAGSGAAGRGGTTGTAGSGVAGRGGAGGIVGPGGTGGGGVCNILCTVGRMCCGGACVNLQNDPLNCGKCGNTCEGGTSFCDNGTCTAPPCQPNVICIGTATCCGNMCCGVGQLCCEEQGPVSGGPPTCYTPTKDQPTCPTGCAPQCRSDRNQKKDIAPVDAQQILDKVARLPISTWTYIDEPSAVRHLGPMAQDFHASFGLGNDDRTYNSVDAHGVALAAIQALERMVAAQERRIENLERENRRLERRRRAADSKRPAR